MKLVQEWEHLNKEQTNLNLKEQVVVKEKFERILSLYLQQKALI